MAKSLREFLDLLEQRTPSELVRVKRQVDPAGFDVSAILEQLDRRGQRPMVLFEDTLDMLGRPSGIPVASNSFADRRRCALALDLPAHDSGLALSLGYAELDERRIPPTIVEGAAAPVKDLIVRGGDVDTRVLPIPAHSEGDYGPCLTMTLAVKDPESGAYNASFIKAFYDFEDHRRLRVTIHSPDSDRALAYYESRDLPMPVAAVLGHHPAFFLGTMGLTPYDSDDYTTIGGFLRESLRLVPSETWGADFLVPADAEIVVEGTVPPGVRVIADPFGDITRQYQAQTLRYAMDVTAITRRRDAILQDVFPGHHDHFTVGQIPKEGSLFNTLRRRFGDVVRAVHLPYSGCGRLACYVSIDKTHEGQAKSVALAAIQESWTFEVVVVVDGAVDVFNELDVVWATLVNVDPSRDVDVIDNIPNVFTTAMGSRKILIDATRPLDRAVPDIIRVPQEAIDRVRLEDYVEGVV